MTFTFTIHKDALKRKFAVYVVVAKSDNDTYLYVGKTGDNREGCNPLISRCGNHFSYNEGHSQVRNHIPDHENRDYTYVFEHFDDYSEDNRKRRESIDRINEMERWLNQEIREFASTRPLVKLVNVFSGKGYLPKSEIIRRETFRNPTCAAQIASMVLAVKEIVG